MDQDTDHVQLDIGSREFSSVLFQNPYSVEEVIEGQARLISFHYGTHVELSPSIDAVWRSAARCEIYWPSSDEATVTLVQHGLLIPKDELPFRCKGLDRPATNPIGEPRRMLFHLPSKEEIVVFGVPSDRGNKIAGSRDGPRIIRRGFSRYAAALQESIEHRRPLIDFSTARSYETSELKLTDYGDIFDDPFASAADLFRRIDFVMKRIVSAAAIPVILGGDHSITASTLLGLVGLSDRPVLLLFDAHHDCYTDSFWQRNGLTHGNFVQHLIDHDAVTGVVQFGLRTLEAVPHDFPHLNGDVRFLSDSEFMEASDEDIMNLLPVNAAYYVSIDLDVLGPEIGGYTATPVFGGLTPRRLTRFLDVLFRNRKMAGMDIVEGRESSPQSTELMEHAAAKILLTFLLSGLKSRGISAFNQTQA